MVQHIEGAQIIPMAVRLKEIARDCFRATPAQIDGTEQQKNEITECGITGRDLMQRIGSAMRAINHNAWVNAWESEVVATWAEGLCPVIVPDVRFQNEIEKIRAMGGIIIRLTRNPHGGDGHESENGLNDYTGFDLVIDQEGKDEFQTGFEAVMFCRENGIV
jgi:hypothetical protein